MIGRLIRIESSTKKELQPLSLGYMEDNLYTAGHFQALFTLPGQNAIIDHLKTGNLNELSEIPEASDMSHNFPDQSVPLKHLSNRIFTKEESSLGYLNSTKRRREEEGDTTASSKKSKLDSTSLKSVCHVCHFKLRKNSVKKRCFFRKLVHYLCFSANRSMCK